MRRGQSLIEMVVAIIVLAVVVPVSMRLLFAMDWALGGEADKLACIGSRAELLQDLGADIRAARRATDSGEGLRLWGPVPLRYYWDHEQDATVRQTIGAEGETRVYPGVRAEFVRRGKMVHVRIVSGKTDLHTAYYLRNR